MLLDPFHKKLYITIKHKIVKDSTAYGKGEVVNCGSTAKNNSLQTQEA